MEAGKKWTDLIKNSIHFFFQVQHVHLEDHHVVRKRSIDQNLRIKLYYDESVYKWVQIHVDIFGQWPFYLI